MARIPSDQLWWRLGGAELARSGMLTRHRRFDKKNQDAFQFARPDVTTCATYYDRNGILRQALANRPRVEWLDLDGDGTFETPSLLLESRRTNQWTFPTDLTNAVWTKTNVTIGASATAPDGTATMQKLVESVTPTVHHFIERLPTGLTDNKNTTVSFYCKAAERTFIRVLTRDKAGNTRQSWFNLTTRAWGTVDANHTVDVLKLPNGSARVMVSFGALTGATAPLVDIVMALADNNAATYTGDGVSGLYVWGLQCEVDCARWSSFIMQTNAALVREADSFNFGQISLWPDVFTVYMKWINNTPTVADTSFPEFWALRSDAGGGSTPQVRGFYGSLLHGFNTRDDINTNSDTGRNTGVTYDAVREYTYQYNPPHLNYYNEDTLIGTEGTPMVTPPSIVAANPRLMFWTGGGVITAGAFGWLLDWKFAHGIYLPADMRAAA